MNQIGSQPTISLTPEETYIIYDVMQAVSVKGKDASKFGELFDKIESFCASHKHSVEKDEKLSEVPSHK